MSSRGHSEDVALFLEIFEEQEEFPPCTIVEFAGKVEAFNRQFRRMRDNYCPFCDTFLRGDLPFCSDHRSLWIAMDSRKQRRLVEIWVQYAMTHLEDVKRVAAEISRDFGRPLRA